MKQIPGFFEAAVQGAYDNGLEEFTKEMNTWQAVAKILLLGKIYE